MVTEKTILAALEEVKDPEIPVISVVELGIVTGIEITDRNEVKVTLTPTFAGCPAVKSIETMVGDKIRELGVENVEVKTNFDVQWSSNMITEKGRRALRKFGLTPPTEINGLVQIEILKNAECPFCGSKNTELKSAFGSTLCRAIHYCNECLQGFEQFKPV
jgi:ring-1,2-phenylacetyl-CoA epoxidase subunit PaaD